MSKDKKETVESVEKNPFEAFSLITNDNVFSSEPKEVPEVIIPEPIVKTEPKKTSKKDEPEVPEVIEEDEPVIPEVIEEPIAEEIEEEAGSFKPFLTHMAQKGILDFEDTEDFEDNDEGLESVVVKTVQNGITSYKQSFPEDAQKFLEFVESGGNPADFHKFYYSDGTFEDFDITDEENQKYVVKEALKLEGYTDEEADEEINDSVDLGKLEKKAQVHLKKLQKVEKEQKELLVEAQKKYAQEQDTLRKQDWDNFKKGLMEKETIAGFKVNTKIKNDIWEYMTKPVDKKTGISQYQKDMNEKGAEARYMYAWLMKTNFDISKLERMVQTKEVSKLKSKLGNFSDSRAKMKSGAPSTPESTDNPFSGFKTLINQ